MDRVGEMRELFEFDAWANGLTLDAVERLPAADFVRDLGSSYPSIRDTLVHVLSAEWVWLERWKGLSPGGLPDGWADLTIREIRAAWAGVEEERATRLAGLTEAELDRVVDYRDTSGTPWRSTVGQILRHVVNHSSYHRGQVTTLLRQLGATPPATDLIHYYRTVAPRPGA